MYISKRVNTIKSQHLCGFRKYFVLLLGLLTSSLFAASSWACTDSNVRFSSSSYRIYLENGAICTLSDIDSIVVNKYSSVTQDQLLEQTSPGDWLLKAEMRIEDGSTLVIHGTSIGGDANSLLLLSENGAQPYHVKIQAKHGMIDINSTSISSWDPTSLGPDTDQTNGRAFIHVNSIEEGITIKESRMDIINSEVSYLGFANAESYGLVWKIRGGNTDPTIYDRLDVYGDIKDSYIHHNYMGMYSYGAFAMIIDNNEIAFNTSYGIDPHDDSDELTISNNDVHDNGNHGIICSRRCNDLIITGNKSYRNKHGIMLHRDTNDSLIADNIIYDNADNGIAIYESHGNTIRNNTITGNKHGIKLSMGSHDNIMELNTIESNSDNALYQYSGNDTPETTNGRPSNNIFTNNIIKNNGQLIKLRDSDDIIIVSNTFEGPTDIDIYDSTNIQIHDNNHLFSEIEIKIYGSDTIATDTSIEVDEPLKVKLNDFSTLELISNIGRIFNAEEQGDTTRIKDTLNNGYYVTSSSLVLDSELIGTTSNVEALPFWVTLPAGEIEISDVTFNSSSQKWIVQSISEQPDVEYRIADLLDGADYILLKDNVPLKTLTAIGGEVTFTEPSTTATAYELRNTAVINYIPVFADTYVRDGFPDTNYNDVGTLNVKLSSSGYNREAFLKFDISAYSTPVENAKLTFYGALSSSGSSTTDIYTTDSTWSETSITWNNKSFPASFIDGVTIDTTSFKTYEVDITDYLNSLINANKTEAAFIFINRNSSRAVSRIRAKEHGSDTEPQIQIQF
ncbi:NosD domain-containing protein [Moritella sp. Urea-trap-13]|uniref:CBM96 family carbohydrate-binding protein n=1 Tax=Moritella sp. Urea-trap-13 TaxID=2058327 RepID=UPI000C34C084|nr:NosD domain-containing protein [Moritella sp. Urea-trap-13]PKH07927.1 hypothetical protein CXF93_04345 [Moritella sp. Urea-trap-13]